jgi:ferric-dicitrate binding protein FerR (iron transport regulator)
MVLVRAGWRAGCAVACLVALASAGRAADDGPNASARAARIGALSGTVSVHGAESGPGKAQWLAAVTDRVLAPGDGLWTQPGAHASLELGGAAVELQEKTQIELAGLSAVDAELRLVQGAVELRLPAFGPGESYQIDTPRGAVRVMQPGRFLIEAGAGDQATRITVLEGTAQVVGSESGLIVASGQIGLVTGVDGGLSYAVQQAVVPGEHAPAPETAQAPVEPAPQAAPETTPQTTPEAAPSAER